MSKNMLLQGITQDSHVAAVRGLLGIPHPEKVLLSVGFMTEGGLLALEAALSQVAERTTIVVGIRNGITSAQGLSKSLEIGCTTYVVDTGSRDILFHPKIYFARNAAEARIIIGSANLTPSGLSSNVEASISLKLGLIEPENATFVADIEAKIGSVVAGYPENVFRVNK